jgi:hypothetical protein
MFEGKSKKKEVTRDVQMTAEFLNTTSQLVMFLDERLFHFVNTRE